MAVDPLNTWISTLAAVPRVKTAVWAQNFADWYNARLSGATTDPASLVATDMVFIFPALDFQTALEGLGRTDDALDGITGFADAWKAAIEAMAYPDSLAVGEGSFVPPSSGATLFSVVESVEFVASSITAAHTKILELATAGRTLDAMLSQFPVKFRDATLLLKVKVTGKDSTDPVPLVADNVPIV